MRRWVGVVIAILLAGAVLAFWHERGPSYPDDDFPGAATIFRDERGIPTVVAAERAALYAGQGYATAEDRIFQMDWSRRRLLGQTAEVLGSETIVADFQSRALGIEACAKALYAQLSDREREAVDAYAAGVNHWLAHNRDRLPAEFARLDVRPRPWRPIDCLVIYRGMALTLTDLTDDLDAERDAGVGSNGWAVAGSRSASGYPILAGDPHLAQTVPGALHEMRLTLATGPAVAVSGGGPDGTGGAPGGVGLAVDGGAEGPAAIGWAIPGVPGISIGRSRAVAFTVTAFSGDASDIFTFPIDPKNPKRYQTPEGWRVVESVKPRVWLRLWGPFAVPVFWQEIETTPWGPVIGRQDGRLRTLRWAGAEPLPGEGLVSAGTLDASSVADIETLLRRQGLPDVNLICADTAGVIAHYRVARLPRRPEHRLPRDGMDPSLDWNGVYDFDELPHEVDPDAGFVASGNGPPPASTKIYLGFDFLVPREARIRSVLAAARNWSAEAFDRLQDDHVSEPARDDAAARLSTLAVDSLNARALAALPILARWDGAGEVDSVGPSLYRAWQALGPGAAGLNAAVDWLAGRYGPDMASWNWGRLHRAVIRHPLGEIDTTWNVPPFPRAGDRATIDVAGYARFDTAASIPARVTHGPALRWMTELRPGGGAWGVSLPGQSERTDSPHRTDQLEMWRSGQLRRIPGPGEIRTSTSVVTLPATSTRRTR